MSWPEVVSTLITTAGAVLAAWFSSRARTHAVAAEKSADRATSQFPIELADNEPSQPE